MKKLNIKLENDKLQFKNDLGNFGATPILSFFNLIFTFLYVILLFKF